jgi:hypothetical protein
MAAVVGGVKGFLASLRIPIDGVLANAIIGALQGALSNVINGKPWDEDLGESTLIGGWSGGVGALIGGSPGAFFSTLLSNAALPGGREIFLPKGCSGKGIHW